MTLRRASIARKLPSRGCDNADVDVHEHPTEWPDEISLEPQVPHPGSDPVEVTTEPRAARPERGVERRPRNRCPATRPRLDRSTRLRASR